LFYDRSGRGQIVRDAIIVAQINSVSVGAQGCTKPPVDAPPVAQNHIHHVLRDRPHAI
jgi:hypothetical protein